MDDRYRNPKNSGSGQASRDREEDEIAHRIAEDLEQLATMAPRVLASWLQRQAEGDYFTLPNPWVIARSLATLGAQMLLHPQCLFESQTRLGLGYLQLWQDGLAQLLGQPTPAITEHERKDRRFQNEAWRENVFFDRLKQAYLFTARELMTTVREITTDLDSHDRLKAEFYAHQFLDALSPANMVTTNPEILQETLRTGGENLLRGAVNLLADLARGRGHLRIRQTEVGVFELGRNIAATPGKVIYQNKLMQLIQYSPATEQVDRRPLLIVPPWINKYYILDLTPKRSFIRWAMEQGLTVFVISWVNPDERYAQFSFDDYLIHGTLAALDAVEQASGENEVNAIGYCIGGTLLACTLAYQEAKGDHRVCSATFFTSLLDFTDVGQLAVFIDEEQIRLIEQHMQQRGYLEGTHLANAFNLLQSNDLIWSFVINNYLLGHDPAAFDLLYWNADSTRMPCRMHSFYLRNMYLNNRLRRPGGISLVGVPIDLTGIRIPAFFLATQGDHIAPWRTCYRSACLLGGESRFVLGGSGHIAGVMNPADSPKYGYWTSDRLPENPDDWLSSAERHPGSWWPEWRCWLKRFAGGKTVARIPGDGRLRPMEDAPGSYVRVRIDALDHN